ncbi:transcriptional regulator, TetR family [Amycolatopsis marina]|uniref:Transcriptional regulator, TetR family n=1 Tax=Amycolatopsis marina TaxID=490629 RepID=A0A1I1AM54_9PSEU|nr:TetR/AcrR family transcriptional regulator [Amycolatopsis marina]SFB37480.1 transcriptional regulator, TetR family [Amycolatopsis marina]
MTSSARPLSRAERKKQELRREIIDAAFECFAERGYHATGIADIAARLGIGHGTFYRYFENKRDIVDHVIDDLVARISTALTAENAPDAVSTLEDYREQTARIGESLARIFGEDPRVPRLLLVEAAGIDKAMAERVLDFFDLAGTLTAAYLAHGVELGYLRADLDVHNTARAITGMIMAAALSSLRRPEPAHQRQLSEAIRRVMYDGIAAHDTPG